MTFGTLFLGLADLALALVLNAFGRSAGYVAFIVPLVLIGAGFVVATTVRTAIVFASTPLGLPASAAAINEASVSLGSRIGVVSATTTVAAVAMDSARSIFEGKPDAEALLGGFEEALVALGTPIFGQLTKGASLEQVADYSTAYLDGVAAALAVGGAVGIAGAILAWVLTGRRDPLHTVFDMQDERGAQPAGESA